MAPPEGGAAVAAAAGETAGAARELEMRRDIRDCVLLALVCAVMMLCGFLIPGLSKKARSMLQQGGAMGVAMFVFGAVMSYVELYGCCCSFPCVGRTREPPETGADLC
ncbi:hypothetical protein ACP70R_042418 [Stipagrostis hirtigluma subsp. patula]